MLRIEHCLCVLLCASGLSAGAQISNSGTTPATTASGRASADPNGNHSLGSELPSMDPNFFHRQMVARREEMKRRMVDGAARLLLLTRDLQTDLQSREATDADAKRLDEIAKLARSVRDQMRQ